MKNKNLTAVIYALAAALFYAVNVPCSKLLLDHVSPTLMAAFLYLGAGLGVGIMYLFQKKKEKKEDRLDRHDLPYTAGMVLLDILAPILLMIGVSTGASSNASLLGNFEIAATTLLALVFFREAVSKWLWKAIGLITLASIMLTFDGGANLEVFTTQGMSAVQGWFSALIHLFSPSSLFVLGAAACWGLENNCTRKISHKSTYQIVTVKGFFSGAGSLLIGLVLGESLPGLQYLLPAMLLGFVAYGLSIFTYVRAQRTLGAARTSAYYAIAPFLGAFLSFVLLGETLSASYLLALLVMAAGTGVVVYDTMTCGTKASHNRNRIFEHTHTFTHHHDGSTHTHTITHSHAQIPLLQKSRPHHHSSKKLEKCL